MDNPDAATPPVGRHQRLDTTHVLSRGFFYSRTPMLFVDAGGRVREVNAALRVLLGTDVAGCRDQEHTFLSGRLRPRLDGELFPAGGVARTRPPHLATGRARPTFGDVRVAEGRCRYRSPGFGRADLATVEVPAIDPATGALSGSVLNVEVVGVDEEAAYREAVRGRWSHEIMWEIYAASYDAVIPQLPFYREVLGRHLAAMSGADIVRVLDIGAGTGTVTVPLANSGKSVTAVDPSRAMLERLGSKLGVRMTFPPDVVEDTAEALPRFADGCFDGVSALNSFFDMTDPHAALREAVRVLRPGGVLVVTDPRECFDREALEAAAERCLRELPQFEELHEDWVRVKSVVPALEERIVANRAPRGEAAHGAPWHAEGLHESLRRSGFVGLSFEPAYEGHCATVRGSKPS